MVLRLGPLFSISRFKKVKVKVKVKGVQDLP
jgi:hypothetical protein